MKQLQQVGNKIFDELQSEPDISAEDVCDFLIAKYLQ
jgi:hypothetical protein